MLLGRPAPGMLPALRKEMELIRRSGFFDVAWYRRYPKGALAADPLVHYVERGARKNLDPNPLFDSKMYRRAHGLGIEENPLVHFLKAGARATAGAYPSVEALRKIQAGFLARTGVTVVHDSRPGMRRFGVFLQCGAHANHREWFTQAPRNWDLVVNLFQEGSQAPEGSDLILRQTGGGCHSAVFAHMMDHFPEIIWAYDYWMLLDDDILTSVDDLNRLFEIVSAAQLDMAQPALTPDSFNIFPALFVDPRGGMRKLNAAEMMVPILSRRLIEAGRFVFSESLSGYASDLVLGKIARTQFGTTPMVIDAVPVRHCKEVNPGGGGYYGFLQKAKISPPVEFRLMVSKYGTEATISELEPGEFVQLPAPAGVG